jgi:hypothetical protein
VRLFRKHLTPEQLGALIYEDIRRRLSSENDLSIDALLGKLGRRADGLPEQYVGAVMVGSMFGAILAIERSTSRWIADRIIDGMQREFARHLEEQGANPDQVLEWESIIADHFLVYRSALEGYEGYEPPWKLGRLFFWNIIGVEEYVAPAIRQATLYILAIRDAAQDLVNEYGPSLVVQIST